MPSERVYQPAGMTVLNLRVIRDYLNAQNSRSLGTSWGHKVYRYCLDYGPHGVIECNATG
jgi:hypothetical protein